MDLENKKVLVVGLGKSGLACARFLRSRGARVRVTDRADARQLAGELKLLGEMKIPVTLGPHEASDFSDAELIVLSPGVPHTIPAVTHAASRGIPVIGEIELAARFVHEPLLAVTGTNGKTTTTMLLGAMLKESGLTSFVGGNIGTPLVDYVYRSPRADRVVVEVSSFQLDTTESFRPHVAVLLNITSDHLDRYPDMAAYAESKARIFTNQRSDDVAVLNAADERVRAIASGLKSRRLFFDSPGEEGARIQADRIQIRCPKFALQADVAPVEHEFRLARYRLPGRHNRENAAAACLAALAAGATPEGIQTALDAFVGLAHRLAHVASIDRVDYYDDSKATNVDATARAVETFHRPVVLILGGRDKGSDWDNLRRRLGGRVKKVIVMGEAAGRIRDCLAPGFPVEAVSGMAQAVRHAGRAAEPGDVVLLAPGCASFDSYTSYAERGDDFIHEVSRMETRHDR